MTNPSPKGNPLYDLEMEVLEEGREWMRQRLEKKLQKLAQAEGRLSPPSANSRSRTPSTGPCASRARWVR